MSAIKKTYAIHSKAVISLVRDVNNECDEVYSCGIDDNVIIWKPDEQFDELVYDGHNCVNDCESAVAVHNNDVYIAECAQNMVLENTVNHIVVRYEKRDLEPTPPLLTFTSEITAMTVSRDGQFLLAGSCDFLVKLLHLNSPEQWHDRYNCDGVVVNVSIDPKCVFFSVSTADGNVQFRTLVKNSASMNKPIAQFKACSPFSQITAEKSRMQVVWQSSGDRVFIPAIGGVMVIDCLKWSQDRMLNLPELCRETFSIASISADDEFFASCTLQSTLVLWKLDGFQPIHSMSLKTTSIPTGLVFSPFDSSAVITAFSEGCLGTIKGVVESDHLTSKPLVSSVGRTSTLRSATPTEPTKRDVNPTSHSNTTNLRRMDSTSHSNNDTTNLRRIDSDASIADKFVDDLATVDDDDEVDVGLIKSQFGFNQDGEFVGGLSSASNLPAFSSTSSKQIPMTNYLSSATGRATPPQTHHQFNPTSLNYEPCATIKRLKIPKTFIAGSTPSQQSQRYLMWNTYGTIRSFRTIDESTIEVTFHDASIHSEIIIDNTAENYVFGDLNTNLIALASKTNSDKESKLFVQHISAWDDSRDWSIKLSNSEGVECLSVGREFIAIFTSFRFLRIFSAAGTQRSIACLPCPLVTMCAHDLTLVAVRATGGVVILSDEEYEHQLMADFFDVQPLSSTQSIHQTRSVPVCLGVESRLEWIAFTNAGRLVTMDSSCTVRLYTVSDGVWVPIIIGAEILKDIESDHLWPIAVLERPEPKFRYLYCRGMKQPSATKSQFPITVKWKLPLLEAESDKSKFEHELMVSELLQSMLRDATRSLPQKSTTVELTRLTNEYAKDLLKLFAQNFNIGRECRAVELAHLTTATQGIQVMCNFAAKKERANISEKIAAIGRNRILTEERSKNLAAKSTYSSNITTISVESHSEQTRETNKIAPNPVRMKRKLSEQNSARSTISQTATKRSAFITSNDDFEMYEETARTDPKTPSSSMVNMDLSGVSATDENLSQISLFEPLDSSGLASSTHNPFKQRGSTTATDTVDDTWRDGTDFFDQLTKNKNKVSNATNSKSNAGKNATKGKRQAKLSFGATGNGTEKNDSMDDRAGSGQPLAEVSNVRKTGFDLWCAKNKSAIQDAYSGDEAEFQKHLVQKFRTLNAEEKKRWNDEAKSQN